MAGKGLPIICGILTAGVTCTLLVLINGTGHKANASPQASATSSAAAKPDDGKKPEEAAVTSTAPTEAAASSAAPTEAAASSAAPEEAAASSAAPNPDGATLSFDLMPKDITPTISINGKQYTTTEIVVPPDPDHPAHIIITAPGYMPYEKEMTIKADGNPKIFATLQKDPNAKPGAAATSSKAAVPQNTTPHNTNSGNNGGGNSTPHRPKVQL